MPAPTDSLTFDLQTALTVLVCWPREKDLERLMSTPHSFTPPSPASRLQLVRERERERKREREMEKDRERKKERE